MSKRSRTTFTPPKSSELGQMVSKASTVQLHEINSLQGRVIDEVELGRLNAVYRLGRKALELARQKENSGFKPETILVSLVDANSPVLLEQKPGAEILQKFVALMDKEIKVEANKDGHRFEGAFTYTQTGMRIGRTHSRGGWNLQMGAQGGVEITRADPPFRKPRPVQATPGIKITSLRIGDTEVPFTQTSIQHKKDWHGIPITYSDRNLCGAQAPNIVETASGTRRFNGVSHNYKLEERPLWLAEIAKDIDPDVKLHAPNGWDSDDSDPRFVVFDFPAHDTQILISRRVGLATLVVKGRRDLSEYENLSYKEVHGWPNVRTVEQKPAPTTQDKIENYQRQIRHSVITALELLGPKKDRNLNWKERPEAMRAILMAFAQLDTLKLDAGLRSKTVAEVMNGIEVPDEALGFERATVNALDKAISRSHEKASEIFDDAVRAEVFGIRSIPEGVHNLPSGIEWAREEVGLRAA